MTSSKLDANEWNTIEPYYAALLAEELRPETIQSWLHRWSDLDKQVWEARAWHKRAKARDATDVVAQAAWQRFTTTVFLPFQAITQQLKNKLLAFQHWQPAPDQQQFLRRLKSEASFSSLENTSIEAGIAELQGTYFKIIGGLTIPLDDQELTVAHAELHLLNIDRLQRESTWRAIANGWQQHRDAINTTFVTLIQQRRQLAHNVGLPDYRAYCWQELGRLDYQPQDCLALHQVIENEVVPVTKRWLERRRHQLGLSSLRPWDLAVDPDGQPPLTPFASIAELEAGMEQVLTRVAPELGRMFSRMRQHDFLDLSSRKGKMPGGEEWFFPITNLPYIHLNAVGSTDDILTLLHECGHAFHDVMSATQQSLVWNMGAPAEFSEFAAMSMTMLALPYLHQQRGGWLPEDQVNRMERGYLESVFVKWLPLAAMVDAFQHWVYTEAPQDLTAADLDAKWAELGERFQPVVDWSTLEGERASGWQQMRLLFSQPFYFIEYAFAHLGALTLWRNALDNPNATWQAYRHALTLGDTRPLAALFEAAGVQLLFDPAFVCETMEFVTTYLDQQNV